MTLQLDAQIPVTPVSRSESLSQPAPQRASGPRPGAGAAATDAAADGAAGSGQPVTFEAALRSARDAEGERDDARSAREPEDTTDPAAESRDAASLAADAAATTRAPSEPQDAEAEASDAQSDTGAPGLRAAGLAASFLAASEAESTESTGESTLRGPAALLPVEGAVALLSPDDASTDVGGTTAARAGTLLRGDPAALDIDGGAADHARIDPDDAGHATSEQRDANGAEDGTERPSPRGTSPLSAAPTARTPVSPAPSVVTPDPVAQADATTQPEAAAGAGSERAQPTEPGTSRGQSPADAALRAVLGLRPGEASAKAGADQGSSSDDPSGSDRPATRESARAAATSRLAEGFEIRGDDDASSHAGLDGRLLELEDFSRDTQRSSIAAGGASQTGPGLSSFAPVGPPPSPAETAGGATAARVLPESLPAANDSLLIEQGRLLLERRGGSARLQLSPPELGRLGVTVRVSDRQVHLELSADRLPVAELLARHLPELQQALTAHGLQIHTATVEHREAADGQSGRAFDDFSRGAPGDGRRRDDAPGDALARRSRSTRPGWLGALDIVA